MDLILPVRVRTCAEDVGRTGECGTGSFGEEPGRASNGRDGEASQRYFAGRRVGLREVRASTLWVKHAIEPRLGLPERDRKSTRLNSSHLVISYAVFCLKKKTAGPVGQLVLFEVMSKPAAYFTV